MIDATPRYNAVYGSGNGPVVLDTVLCSGSEQRLVDCNAIRHGYSTCSHSHDAGVECSAGEGAYIILISIL